MILSLATMPCADNTFKTATFFRHGIPLGKSLLTRLT